MNAFLLVLSAPSGGGKTTIAKALLERRDDVMFSVSATTRPPRDGEQDGVDYHFLSDEEFDRRAEQGDFLESAEFSGHRYGTLQEEVDRIMRDGRHALLDIEIQGARTVRERGANVVSIFILPPSTEELVQRLRLRCSEDPSQLNARLERAVEEIGEAAEYDYIVVNEDRAQAVDDVTRIIDAEAHRTHRLEGIDMLLNDLRDGIAQQARVASNNEEGTTR